MFDDTRIARNSFSVALSLRPPSPPFARMHAYTYMATVYHGIIQHACNFPIFRRFRFSSSLCAPCVARRSVASFYDREIIPPRVATGTHTLLCQQAQRRWRWRRWRWRRWRWRRRLRPRRSLGSVFILSVYSYGRVSRAEGAGFQATRIFFHDKHVAIRSSHRSIWITSYRRFVGRVSDISIKTSLWRSSTFCT